MQSNGKFTVLYAGNLGPLQALETAIDAAALLADEPQIQIVFIGTGQSEAGLKARAEAKKLRNVLFLGAKPLERMNAFNATADALLVHLRDSRLMRSTTPSKTQVAMACAKPVLMGVAGDATEIVNTAGAGMTFQPENPRSMAAAIMRLHALSPDARRSMGEAGRRYYEANMSLDVGASRIERIIQQALVEDRAPAERGVAGDRIGIRP
jgi:glycosyltransferase involved in cell wall biosynthesis